MKTKHFFWIGVAAAMLLASTSIALAGHTTPHSSQATTTLIEEVRRATAGFQDVKAAEAAGYALFHGCVNGPQEGAMGVHFVNGDLVGDGKVDATKPEAVIYEMKNGQMRLVGVEYVVLAEAWDKANKTPPCYADNCSPTTAARIAMAFRPSTRSMCGRSRIRTAHLRTGIPGFRATNTPLRTRCKLLQHTNKITDGD